MSDFETAFIELERQATQFAQMLAGSIRNVTETSGSSEGGGVVVSVRPDGSVTAVEVRATWRREATPAELGGLVLNTIPLAVAEQTKQWVAGLASQDPDQRPTAPASEPPTATPPPRGPDGDRYAQDIFDSVGGVDGAIEDLIASLHESVSARFTAQSDDGRATATADGRGQLVALAVDEVWAESADDRAISHSVTTAVRRANDRAASGADQQAIIKSSRLGQLQQALLGTHIHRS